MKKVKVYSAFDRPDHEGYDFFDEMSPVQQHFRDQSDINFIVNYWSRTGNFSSVNPIPARYVDCTAVQDYQNALDTLCKADEILEAMTPQQRLRFHNDPIAFIEYFSDPANIDELKALDRGLQLHPKERAPHSGATQDDAVSSSLNAVEPHQVADKHLA
ncbi:VP3 [Gokushovirus WZ-2015a]|nr:VP3 [Gokushovirus WZ-2015a]